jgi:hypothetical protein
MDVNLIRTLLDEQQQINQKIESTVKNLRKTPSDKRNATGLKPFIETLKSLYQTFAKNHIKIINAGGDSQDYIKKYDQSIEEYEISVRPWANRNIPDASEKWPTMDRILAGPEPPAPELSPQLINLGKPTGAVPKLSEIQQSEMIQTDQPPVQAVFNWADQVIMEEEEAAKGGPPQDPNEILLQAVFEERDLIKQKLKSMERHCKEVERRLSEEMSKKRSPPSTWAPSKTFPNAESIFQNNRGTSQSFREDETSANPQQPENPISEAPENSNANIMGMIAKTLQKLTDSTISKEESSTSFRTPELSLQPFSGNYKDWRPFKIAIEAQLANSRFNDDEKFSYLRSKLTGSALSEVQDMAFLGDNYHRAIQMLEARFSNPNRVIRDLINKFLREKEDPPEKPSSYLRIIRSIKATSNNLDHLGPNDEEKWKTLFMVTAVISMFSPPTLERWNDWFSAKGTRELQGQRFPTLDEIMNFVEKEYTRSLEKETSENPKKPKTAKSVAFVTTDDSKFNCFACGQGHKCTDCPLFLAAKNKVEFLMKHKVCIRCAKHKYVRGEPCRIAGKLQCGDCSGKHLTVLCAGKKPASNESQTSTPQINPQVMLCHAGQNILPTARAICIGEKGLQVDCRLLIDNCAQLNFITESMAQKLGLKKIKAGITVAGISDTKTSVVAKARFSIISKNQPCKRIPIEAFIVPKIAKSLPNLPKEIDWEKLQIPLAEKVSNASDSIDVLIGCSIGAEIIDKEKENKKVEGFLLQPSTFGYLVSGPANTAETKRTTSAFVTAIEFENDIEQMCFETPFTKDDQGIANQEIREAIEKVQQVEKDLLLVFDPPPTNANALEKSSSAKIKTLNHSLAEKTREEEEEMCISKSTEPKMVK